MDNVNELKVPLYVSLTVTWSMYRIIIIIFRPSVLNSRGYKISKSKQVRPQRRLLGGESAIIIIII